MIVNALFFVLIEFASLMTLFLLNKSIDEFLGFLKGFGKVLFLVSFFPYLTARNGITTTFIIDIIVLLVSIIFSIFAFVSNKATIWAIIFLSLLGIAGICLIVVSGAILLGITLILVLPGYILRQIDIKKKIHDNQMIINRINSQNMGENNYSAFNRTQSINNFNKTRSFSKEDLFSTNKGTQSKIKSGKPKNILSTNKFKK